MGCTRVKRYVATCSKKPMSYRWSKLQDNQTGPVRLLGHPASLDSLMSEKADFNSRRKVKSAMRDIRQVGAGCGRPETRTWPLPQRLSPRCGTTGRWKRAADVPECGLSLCGRGQVRLLGPPAGGNGPRMSMNADLDLSAKAKSVIPDIQTT